jgi:ATP-binding cassette, subfamily F, member 3
MIQLKNISLSFGTQVIFDAISCYFSEDQRIGLVGRNGTGKSTLLKIIAGQLQPCSGTVSIGKDKKIAYMPQEMVLQSDKSVFDEAFSVFDEYIKLEEKKNKLEDILESSQCSEDDVEQYSVIQEKLALFDRSNAEKKTDYLLKGLGFKTEHFTKRVQELSVGWKMRLVLVQLLLQDADFYLFDEPTNHLDIVSKKWFFDFLSQARFGFLLVSHDRYYLEKGCEYIVELERGKSNLFTGNFAQYLIKKEQQRIILQSSFERQQKEIAQKQETIERFRYSATKAKMAQSMIKQLDKIERIEVEPLLPTIKLNFPQSERAGAVVLSLRDIKHCFNNTVLFQDVAIDIQRGEKIALVAPNGTGKTTLFNLIASKYALQQGSIHFGHNVHYSIFEQDQLQVLKPSNTIYEEVLDACSSISESTIRTFLGSFLFSGDDIYKKIKVLSGGERNRVAMIKVLLQKANLLLLDEPTNHLDLYSKEVLLQALQQYSGTIFLVSHDHDFLNKLATRVLELTPEGLQSYSGNYDDYLEHKRHIESAQVKDASNSVKEPQKSKEQSEVINKIALQKEVVNSERKIAQLEKDIKKIYELFETHEANGTNSGETYNKLVAKFAATQASLNEHMEKWEQLLKKLE